MVEYNESQLDAVLHALSDATRRSILRRVAQSERTVSEIAEPYEISLAAVSKHLQVLERARLITRKKSGRRIYCRMNYPPMVEVWRLLREYRAFWEDNLDSLEHYFDKSPEEDNRDEHK